MDLGCGEKDNIIISLDGGNVVMAIVYGVYAMKILVNTT